MPPPRPPDAAPGESELRQALVDKLKADGVIRTPTVEAAFRAVPRHLFVPDVPLADAYRDQSIATKRVDGVAISSCSQPAMMAIMLEQLGVEPGQRVLEIGAGTGYNAALLAQLVGDTGQVVTLDIDEDLVAAARAHLAAAGCDRVAVYCGDGAAGHAPGAPYDRIILTVGAPDIAPAWWQQLAPAGRLVLPLAIGLAQKSVAFVPVGDHLQSRSLVDCGFIMLRGTLGHAVTTVPLAAEPGLLLTIAGHPAVDAAAIYGRLTGPAADLVSGVRLTVSEYWAGLGLWLTLHHPAVCSLHAEGAWADRPLAADFLGRHGSFRYTQGLLAAQQICLLVRAAPAPLPADAAGDSPAFDLAIRCFGADDHLRQQLIGLIQGWDAAGRPGSRGLYIKAYPHPAVAPPAPGEITIPARSVHLVLGWEPAPGRPPAAE
ncbi:MAG TPA: methyltransferase, FxLD system [Chloroflexia bacterium]|nr:methyltransferase, FxLD system [Chloroflexia bacterium]